MTKDLGRQEEEGSTIVRMGPTTSMMDEMRMTLETLMDHKRRQ